MKVLLVNGSRIKTDAPTAHSRRLPVRLRPRHRSRTVLDRRKAGRWVRGMPSLQVNGTCVFNDSVNQARAKLAEADGFVFGTPVHYAHAASSLLGFMDRLFYADGKGGTQSNLRFKPAAAVLSARRAGTTAAFEDINKFFTIAQMPIVARATGTTCTATPPKRSSRMPRASGPCGNLAATWPGCSSASRRGARQESPCPLKSQAR
mgnify:CR=1 FL=1